MISYKKTITSKDNQMPIWNTKSNELAWKLYVSNFDKNDPMFKYASPSLETDYSNLPPLLTYVGTEDPFFEETSTLIQNLTNAGVDVKYKIFDGCFHGFDVVCPLAQKSKETKQFLIDGFEYALKNYIKKDNKN